MPKTVNFTLDELLKQKEDLVNKLNELENSNVNLDEITDDKEIKAEINSLKEDIKEVNAEIKETEPVENKENKVEIKKDESTDLAFESKIVNIINSVKQQNVLKKYSKEVETLVFNFNEYMNGLMSEFDEVKIITARDIGIMDSEYKSLRDEFEVEFSKILNKLPDNVDFDESLYSYIVGVFQNIEKDLNEFRK